MQLQANIIFKHVLMPDMTFEAARRSTRSYKGERIGSIFQGVAAIRMRTLPFDFRAW
jgi:hypothetical protein